jgi:hypothetical protein
MVKVCKESYILDISKCLLESYTLEPYQDA